MDAAQNTTRVNTPSHPDESSEELKSDIHRTRQRMDQTIDEIGERLHPRNLIEDVFDMIRNRTRSNDHHVRDSLRKASGTVLDEIKNNPVPSLLIGAGLAWLIMGRGEDDQEYLVIEEEEDVYGEIPEMDPSGSLPAHYQEQGKEPRSKRLAQSARNKAQELKEKASSGIAAGMEKVKSKFSEGGESMHSAGERARHRLSDAGHNISEQGRLLKQRGAEAGSQIKHQLEDAYETTRRKVSETADEYPMATGLGMLALGVIAGLALPRTRTEDEYVGEMSEQVKEKAQQVGEEMVERGKHVAEATVEAVSREAEAQGLTPEQLKEKAMATAEQAKAAAMESGRQQQVDPGNLQNKAQAVIAKGKETAEKELRHQKEDLKQSMSESDYSGAQPS